MIFPRTTKAWRKEFFTIGEEFEVWEKKEEDKGNHMGVDCQVGNPFANNSSEQANFVSNYQRQNNPYSNTYNPGWRNHPNFSWSNSQNISKPPPGFQNQQQEKKLNMEEAMVQFMAKVDARFQDHDIALKNNENTMRSIERTVGQLATLMSERSQGSLPSTTEKNPKEQIKAITLRSGKELNLQEKEKNSEKEGRGIETAASTPKSATPSPVPSQTVKNSGNPPGYQRPNGQELPDRVLLCPIEPCFASRDGLKLHFVSGAFWSFFRALPMGRVSTSNQGQKAKNCPRGLDSNVPWHPASGGHGFPKGGRPPPL
ncbi:hypothetical protein RHGRI_038576 [Rhododendron griersonianum]|uniref:Uncharacterized protein n=1 Tax=Rhododendron griersonianum TaxID=479676 RepID=A0AAV6HJQ5_9ERIC|nr:hypothetical protein RHGRI_038576 [Rhododendron griersonianum]